MAFLLFTLSNIIIPLALISFKTLLKVREGSEMGAANWFFFIVYTLASNFLFHLLYDNKIYLILDLVIKLLIPFMPNRVCAFIEVKISHLHLEILIDMIRSFVIEKFYAGHSWLIKLVFEKMDAPEQKQFRAALCRQLDSLCNPQKTKSNGQEDLQISYQRFENIGITCHILTRQNILNQTERQSKFNRILSQRDLHKVASEKKLPLEGHTLQPDGVSGGIFRKKNTFLMKKSDTELGFDEGQEKKETRYVGWERNNSLPPAVEESPFMRQNSSEILNRLDASEYSQIFDNNEKDDESEDEDGGSRLLLKLEAIVEINTSERTRLQVYNIQLYSNDDLRILSLSGREFEKHKLISMKKQKYNYYELNLEGGKINKRRVKFRGQYRKQIFDKFILSD